MSIFSKVTKLFAPKQAPVTVQKFWRNGMWVIHHGKIAVIANLGEPFTEIHYADKVSGETISVNFVSLSELRQARYSEIPLRRQGISLDAAKELGYAP